jgi:hypothetical protein
VPAVPPLIWIRLAQGVVDRGVGGRAVGQGLQSAGVVVGRGDGGIARRVAGGIIPVGAGEGVTVWRVPPPPERQTDSSAIS